MFEKTGAKMCCRNFKYSVIIHKESLVIDQPLAAQSLKKAIDEAMDFECSIQPKLGLNAIKMFEIKSVGGICIKEFT